MNPFSNVGDFLKQLIFRANLLAKKIFFMRWPPLRYVRGILFAKDIEPSMPNVCKLNLNY